MRTGQRGAILAVAVVLIVVIALMIATLGFLYVSNLRSSSLHSSSEQAYFAALSGLERATRVLNSPTLSGAIAPNVNRVACASLTGNASVTNVTVAANLGQFTVTGGAAVSPATAVTLNGALTANATVIPVTTLAALGGYSASGRIMIDRELMDYSTTSNVDATCGVGLSPCFAGVRRGMAGTTAATHVTGTRVGQFQCNVQSTGFMPDSANARAKRILSQGTQLHEGWAVGAAGGVGSNQRPWFVRFQQTTWSNLTDAAFIVNSALNSVFMLSNADGFAVGNNAGGEVIYRWNVSPAPGWTRMGPVAAVPDVNLFSVHCTASDSCWAVGAVSGGNVVLARYTGGANWTMNAGDLPAPAIAVQLNEVFCVAANDCWAVGNADAVPSEVILRWTGAAPWARNGPIAGIPNVNLTSVHCAATNDCWAVGAASGGNVMIIRWQGGPDWVYDATVLPAVAINVQLNSVFCAGVDDCWAVGNADAVPSEVILRWQGGVGARWTRVGPSAGIANIQLNSVMCVKTDDCWIVGNVSGSEVIVHWDGTSWTQMAASASVANRSLNSVYVIGAAQRAPAARQEVYP